MERKIGEIFEYNGEWYQCIRSSDCSKCDLKIIKDCRLKFPCESLRREDCEEVIFKKLKKVGEPFSDEYFGLVQKYELEMYGYSTKDKRVCFADGYDIFIKIKQNKEDMEMRKVFMNGDDRDYLLDRLENILHDNHCLEYKDEICNSFCKYITSNNRELKPFNLEAAKAGKPVCTRDGRSVRIIAFDAKRKDEKNIIALVPSKDYPGFEDLITYPNNGNYYGGHENDGDLMMLPEKKEGWINISSCPDNGYSNYDSGVIVFKTKEEAVNFTNNKDYIDTVKVTWEE